MKPAAKYRVSLSVPGLPRGHSAVKKFNASWGFEDGSCNEFVDGRYVAREPYPEGFEEAHRQLYRASQVTVEVSVYQDGTKSFRIIERKS